jgi:hypothetical protein
MRALWRRFLAPVIMAGAILSAGASPFLAEAAHASVPLADCPAGTNWDHVTMTCV